MAYGMIMVKAPVIGSYEVQTCPNCGCKPCVDVDAKKVDLVDSLEYRLHAEVYCSACGLSAPSVATWNKLRVEQEKNNDSGE